MANRKAQPSIGQLQYRHVDPKHTTNLSFAEHTGDSSQTGFERVAAWVDRSLEAFKPELSQVQMPCPRAAHAYKSQKWKYLGPGYIYIQLTFVSMWESGPWSTFPSAFGACVTTVHGTGTMMHNAT
jgi:hypothetical protein